MATLLKWRGNISLWLLCHVYFPSWIPGVRRLFVWAGFPPETVSVIIKIERKKHDQP